MNDHANDGNKPNHKIFSTCSIKNITRNLKVIYIFFKLVIFFVKIPSPENSEKNIVEITCDQSEYSE